MTEFKKLFEPGRIGKLEIKNRMIMAPCVTYYPDEQGAVSDRLIEYYARRSRGGVGLLIVESSYPRSAGYPGRIFVNDEKFMPGLTRLAKAIREGGAKAIIQLNTHRGRADKWDPASPSDIPHPVTGVKPRQITIADLKKLEEDFGEGVRRAKEAGFDGVMIHGGTGYLVSEFLSPRINKRTDEYGRDLRGRARFALELLQISKEKAGSDYPIIFRLTSDERIEGGFQVKDAIEVCKMLQEIGADAVDIISGGAETTEWTAPPMHFPQGYNTDLSGVIRKELRIPVSVAGRINEPAVAEDILKQGKADFVSLGRALIADPDFPKKAMEGRTKDICKCVGCLRCGEDVIINLIPMRCTVNPAVGREKEFESRLRTAQQKKKVLVIGGGPGGMEAATIAAQKGHNVTLWEKSDRLGGQLNLAFIPPGKGDLNNLLDYLKAQLDKSKVSIEFRKEATVESVRKFAPDAAIVAMGSSPFLPDIQGIRQKNVLGCREVLSGEKQVGRKVVVMGGGYVGCETAEFLTEKGKDVTLVFRSPEPALDVAYPGMRNVLLKRLKDKRIKTVSGVKKYNKITPKGIEFVNKEGEEVFLEVNHIVLATGAIPDKTLAQSLKGKVPELYEIGDCIEARRLLEAVWEGADAALGI